VVRSGLDGRDHSKRWFDGEVGGVDAKNKLRTRPMGVGAGLYMCDVVKKSSRSLSHLLMSSFIEMAKAFTKQCGM